MLGESLERVDVITGDITRVDADAIVNAANESLLGGGGVDGAIHRAAGPQLLEHNQKLGGCHTGLAKMTPSFDLAARGIHHVIHTVGPVWHSQDLGKLGDNQDDVLLASCYQQCLDLAARHTVNAIAFPAISTGIYRFPKVRAAKIAVGHVLGFLGQHRHPEQVIFCCFSDDDAQVYRQVIDSRDQWMFNRKR